MGLPLALQVLQHLIRHLLGVFRAGRVIQPAPERFAVAVIVGKRESTVKRCGRDE